MIDLEPDHLVIIRAILAEYLPECEARAFGSRVRGTDHHPYSDLDLALKGKKKIDRERLSRLEEAFALSDLPIKVDVLDWWAVSSAFREEIGKRFEIV
ncbi:MAG: nucleotidyltransferase domain-containing protein [Magnetococcales bacterium]|nr:nucleotidyltransferase domain-containing protein [Magnetococcales bacterium]